MKIYLDLMLGIIFTGVCVKTKQTSTEDLKRTRYYFFPATCIFIILWAMMAFKGENIGSDTPSYIRVFNEAVIWYRHHSNDFWSSVFVNDSRFETGYIVFNRIVAGFTSNPQWIFILSAVFIVTVCKKFVYKKSMDIYLSIFLFISLRFFYFCMSGIRQAVAIFVCIIAYRYVEKRKFIFFFLLVLLAMQFHITAVVFLAVYPISKLRFNKKNCIFVTVIGLIVFFAFDYILNKALIYLPEYYSHYTSTVRFEEGKLGNLLVCAIQIIFLIMSVFSGYGKKEDIEKNAFDEPALMKYMMLISILLSVVSLRATTLDRLFYYFWIFSIVYIPNVVKKIEGREVVMIRFLIILFTILYNMTLLYYRPEWSCVTPYSFFWN